MNRLRLVVLLVDRGLCLASRAMSMEQIVVDWVQKRVEGRSFNDHCIGCLLESSRGGRRYEINVQSSIRTVKSVCNVVVFDRKFSGYSTCEAFMDRGLR